MFSSQSWAVDWRILVWNAETHWERMDGLDVSLWIIQLSKDTSSGGRLKCRNSNSSNARRSFWFGDTSDPLFITSLKVYISSITTFFKFIFIVGSLSWSTRRNTIRHRGHYWHCSFWTWIYGSSWDASTPVISTSSTLTPLVGPIWFVVESIVVGGGSTGAGESGGGTGSGTSTSTCRTAHVAWSSWCWTSSTCVGWGCCWPSASSSWVGHDGREMWVRWSC